MNLTPKHSLLLNMTVEDGTDTETVILSENPTGKLTGNQTGNLTGNLTRNLTRNLTGNRTWNLPVI